METLSREGFGFSKQEIIALASITYHAVLHEASISESFSGMRKYVRSEAGNLAKQAGYRHRKKEWAEQWKATTSKLLEIKEIIDTTHLASAVSALDLSDAKRNAMIGNLWSTHP